MKREFLHCFAIDVYAFLPENRIVQVNQVNKLTGIVLHYEICRRGMHQQQYLR